MVGTLIVLVGLTAKSFGTLKLTSSFTRGFDGKLCDTSGKNLFTVVEIPAEQLG